MATCPPKLRSIPAPDTIQRRIYFFRIQVEPDGDGNPQVFSAAQACSAISHLRFLDHTRAGSRYLDGDRPGEVIGIWPKTQGGKMRLSIGTSRRGALPNLEELGNVSPLTATAAQGVLDQTHLVIFPDEIVGAEFNFHGPRLSKFADYLSTKCPTLPNISFLPLLNRNIQEKLEHLEDVHLLQLRLHKSNLSLLQQASSHLPGALRATCDKFDAPVIDLSLRPDTMSQLPLGAQALNLVRQLVGMPSVLENAELFRVRGRNDQTHRIEWFDFLKDKLFFTEEVVKQDRHRSVDSADMFSKIEEVHNENKNELQEAAGIGE